MGTNPPSHNTGGKNHPLESVALTLGCVANLEQYSVYIFLVFVLPVPNKILVFTDTGYVQAPAT